MKKKLREVTGLIIAVMREIFDESAYERFLLRQKTVSSREAYAHFLREHAFAKARRPKCC